MKRLFMCLTIIIVSLSLISSFILFGCKIEEAVEEVEEEAVEEVEEEAEETVAEPDKKFYTDEEVLEERDRLVAVDYDKKLTIANFWVLATHTYGVTSIGTLQDELEKAGHELLIFDGNLDPVLQADQIDDAIALGVDLIDLFPIDSNAIVPSVKKAYDAGIPVLISYAKIAEEAMEYTIGYVGPDDYLVGATSAELMEDILDGEGQVAIIEGAASQENVILRTKGFQETLQSMGSKIEVVSVQPTEWDQNKATEIMEDLIIRFPELDAVFAHDDLLGAAANVAVKEAGLTTEDIKIVGYGGSKDGLAAIAAGNLYGTHMQSAVTSGILEAVKVLEWFDEGMELGDQFDPYYNFQPFPFVNQDNVDEFLPGDW